MNAAMQSLGAAALFGGCLLGALLDGPSDTQAAQDVFDDTSTATQLARDTAACHQHYGPNAQILMLDGVHLVCRPAAAATTAQVQP